MKPLPHVVLLVCAQLSHLPAPAAEPADHEINSRISQLGSPSFREREAATRALDSMGGKALPALRHAASVDPDPEVRRRASQVAQVIETRLVDERSFQSHMGEIYSLAFVPGGRALISTGYDHGKGGLNGALRVWDVATQKELRQYHGKGIVYAQAITADGKRVFAGAQDGDLCLWDLGNQHAALRRFPIAKLGVMALAVSPNGRWLVSGSNDGKRDMLQLWDLEAGREVRTLKDSAQRPTYSLTFLPDSQTILSGGVDAVIRLWDVREGKVLIRLKGHTETVTQVTASPDGRWALSSSRDNSIRLWDLNAGHETRCFRGHTDAVRAIKFLPEGRRALSASHDSTVRLWNLQTGEELRRFNGSGGRFSDLAIAPDGKQFAAGKTDGKIQLWRLLE